MNSKCKIGDFSHFLTFNPESIFWDLLLIFKCKETQKMSLQKNHNVSHVSLLNLCVVKRAICHAIRMPSVTV